MVVGGSDSHRNVGSTLASGGQIAELCQAGNPFCLPTSWVCVWIFAQPDSSAKGDPDDILVAARATGWCVAVRCWTAYIGCVACSCSLTRYLVIMSFPHKTPAIGFDSYATTARKIAVQGRTNPFHPRCILVFLLD